MSIWAQAAILCICYSGGMKLIVILSILKPDYSPGFSVVWNTFLFIMGMMVIFVGDVLKKRGK